jgi:hypothetical protein
MRLFMPGRKARTIEHMRRGSLFGAGWLAALAVAGGALGWFGWLANRAWTHRLEPIDVRTAITHPHLLSLGHRTEAELVLLPTLAMLCVAAVPLLRAGVRAGLRSWRGVLAVTAFVAAMLMTVAVYRYQHPTDHLAGRYAAGRDARTLASVAGGLLLATLVGITATGAKHRRRAGDL